MDFFQHRYYRINKILLKLLGLWPYQSIRVRIISVFVILSFVVSGMVPQVIIIMKNLDDRDFIMECAVPLITEGEFFGRLFIFAFNSRKMLKLLNRIRSDWEVWNQDCDIDILHQYAEKGRKLTKFYAAFLMTICIIFLTVPVIPKIIDVLLKNGTEPGQFPVPVDYYFIDMQQNYFYVIVHWYVGTIMVFLTAIAFDCLFVVYVQHSCGLFAILRNAELLDSTYTWFFFTTGAFIVLLISMVGVQIIERTNERATTIKFIFCIIGAMGNVYIGSYMGHLIIDHSISIGNYIFHGKWYTLPLKARKLLVMIMMRSNIPCKLTAGKLTFMSVETFVALLKTSLSYFTLLRSV